MLKKTTLLFGIILFAYKCFAQFGAPTGISVSPGYRVPIYFPTNYSVKYNFEVKFLNGTLDTVYSGFNILGKKDSIKLYLHSKKDSIFPNETEYIKRLNVRYRDYKSISGFPYKDNSWVFPIDSGKISWYKKDPDPRWTHIDYLEKDSGLQEFKNPLLYEMLSDNQESIKIFNRRKNYYIIGSCLMATAISFIPIAIVNEDDYFFLAPISAPLLYLGYAIFGNGKKRKFVAIRNYNKVK